MKIRTIVASLLIFGAVLVPAKVFAHSGMYNAKFVDGGNITLLTYNVDHLESGYPIKYNFRLFDTTGVPIPFQQAHVTFKSGNSVDYDESLPVSDVGDISLTHTFPQNGTHTMNITFFDNGKEISKAEFPIAVERGPNQSLLADITNWQSAAIFIFGGIAMYVFLKKNILINRLQHLRSTLQKRKSS